MRIQLTLFLMGLGGVASANAFYLAEHDAKETGRGDTGAAIVPGEPDKSLLIKAVRYTDEELQMPPRKGGGGKLAAEQIADLETWVKMGAPDPRVAATDERTRPETIAAKARQHWAFQPLRLSSVPEVRNRSWVRTPVDAFVLARLEDRKLSPSPQADKRTLLRRATSRAGNLSRRSTTSPMSNCSRVNSPSLAWRARH